MRRPGPCLLAGFLISLLPAACTRPPDCFDERVICAALVTDTLGKADHGLNQDAWEGLERSRAGGVLDHTAFIESVDARDYSRNIGYFAQRGYDAIVTSGAALMEETLEASSLHPQILFIGINQSHELRRPNLVLVTIPEDQIGFLAGALAARLTETGVVAGVCETSGIESMRRYCEGFRAGAASVHEGIRTLIAHRDDGAQEALFIDEAWGADRARELVRRGADVIFAAGGATGQGALAGAAGEGVYAIGAERDQAAVLPGAARQIVTSVYGRPATVVQTLLSELGAGPSTGAVSAPFDLVPLGEQFPQSLSVEMNALVGDLTRGVVKTNVNADEP